MTSLWRRFFLWICGILAAAGVVVPVVLALFGSENHLLFAMKDDGFYFLALARNIAHGHGATFDGLGPTNGFHPLWALLLTPIFCFSHSSVYTPIRITILLATALHLAGAVAVSRAAREVTDRESARLAGLLYLGNPLAIYLVVSGMESPLAALLVAVISRESILLRRGRVTLSDRGTILRLGILGGLCALARTDLVLLIGLILAGALLIRPEKGTVSFTARMRGSVSAGAIAVAVVSPWIVWSLARFHTVVQVSARAHHLHSLSQRAIDSTSGDGGILQLGPSLLTTLFDRIAARTGQSGTLFLAALLVVFGVLLAWIASLLRPPDTRRDLWKRLRRIDAPLLYAAGFLFAAFFVLGHIRSWYLAGPLAVGGILAAVPVFYSLREERRGRFGRFLSGLIFAGILLGTVPLWRIFSAEVIDNAKRINPWREASAWVVRNTGPDDRVASFNSGTFGYLTPRTVINLDCVINNRAIEWLERRQLVEYLQAERVRYVIDEPGYVWLYFKSYAGDDWRETVVPGEKLRSGLRVYEVR